MDVGGEIYIQRNFGSVNVAKEYVPAQFLSFAAIERDAQRLILDYYQIFRKLFRIPLTSNLSPQAGRGGGALAIDVQSAAASGECIRNAGKQEIFG